MHGLERKDNPYSRATNYSSLVSKDSYLIVEDTNTSGHPVLENLGPRRREAAEEFLTHIFHWSRRIVTGYISRRRRDITIVRN
jgi:hypothetical protein